MSTELGAPCQPLDTLGDITIRRQVDGSGTDGHGNPIKTRTESTVALLAPVGAQQVEHDLDRDDRTRIEDTWQFWIANGVDVLRPRAGDLISFAGCEYKVEGVIARTAPCCATHAIIIHHYEVSAIMVTG